MRLWAVASLLFAACRSSSSPAPPTDVALPVPSPAPSRAIAAAADAQAPEAADAEVDAGAIDVLVARLSKNRFWSNGHFHLVKLAQDAPEADVVADVLENVWPERGRLKSHHVIVIRHVLISGAPYTAALAQTAQGDKIVLVRYEPQLRGWWSRVFEA